MARLAIGDQRVQDLINSKVIPLFFTFGSVHTLCEQLNTVLEKSKKAATLYPNRVHALLSDDPSKSLNESTIQLIEEASAQIKLVPMEQEHKSRQNEWSIEVTKRWELSTKTGQAIIKIAQALLLPPTIVRYLLQKASLVVNPFSVISGEGVLSPPTQSHFGHYLEPDWSFQDIARQRCHEAFAKGPDRKVGLVVPTGGGKTRIALRIALDVLRKSPTSEVIWVTHRINLRIQTRQELQEMIDEEDPGLPKDSAKLLAEGIHFLMISQVPERFSSNQPGPALVIVDEAHHAAAESYAPLFEFKPALAILALTATPNRTDGLPIGIDEIAYSITYKELVDRRVILMPEFRPFPVDNFDWSPETINDLADHIIQNSENEYKKVLVIAPQISRVKEFYEALVKKVNEEHYIIEEEDIGYITSEGNSLQVSPEEFLATFSSKPRGVIVSAQMLLEGFNDPRINTVVITYWSSSLVLLMQAAGRCVRSYPGKQTAYVIQAQNADLAYYFERRWLYQEISDYLRPDLEDIEYSDHEDFVKKVGIVLESHRVADPEKATVLSRMSEVQHGEDCHLLLSGLPYFGPRDRFIEDAYWSVLLETSSNGRELRYLFNEYCARGAELVDLDTFLLQAGGPFGLRKTATPGSNWTKYTNMLISMTHAKKEIYEDGGSSAIGKDRPFQKNHHTTWLKYVTFRFRPQVPLELTRFLEDCYNSSEILSVYRDNPSAYALVVKIPVPLESAEAHLLDATGASAFHKLINELRDQLSKIEPRLRLRTLAAILSEISLPAIPLRVITRVELFINVIGYETHVRHLQVSGGDAIGNTQAKH